MNPTNVFIYLSHDSLPIVMILDFNVSKLHGIPDQPSDETLKLMEKLDLEKSSLADHKTRYSMFTKTGTPLYTAPEMQVAGKYS